MTAKKAKSRTQVRTAPARKTRVSYKDVEIAYLMNGMAGVEALDPNKLTVQTACQHLVEGGRNADPLIRWAIDKFGVTHRGRGRPPVTAGEDRPYKAQQLGEGGTFLRLPLDVLGAKKGATLKVHFEQDQIIVSR